MEKVNLLNLPYIREYTIETWEQLTKMFNTCSKKEHFKKVIFRGQADANWQLTPTLFRSKVTHPQATSDSYYNRLSSIHELVVDKLNRHFDLSSIEGKNHFISFLQHHGLPTPFLDWTSSPYIAAYFAFEDIEKVPACEQASIYIFHFMEWMSTYKQETPNSPQEHISFIPVSYVNNERAYLQQSSFTIVNTPDFVGHISRNSTKEKNFLAKLNIPYTLRDEILRELSLMNITASSLMPSIESVMKDIKTHFYLHYD